MAGTNLGKAYVQIVPSAEGIKGSITNVLGGEADSAGQSAGSSIAGKIKGAIAAAGIGAVLKSALSEGADLQQSFFGGLDTLYGEAADKARDFARAASEAGISANTYAEQAVSFGAALKQSLGGDAVAAAEMANLAILDMADNSAKMGTNIESIQTAYQGFAKQNYAMLDNLKLGYGGTGKEMHRLMQDAKALDSTFDAVFYLDAKGHLEAEFADIVEAIHIVQENLGLAGVAAQEASDTFSGSFGAMKAAAQNFLGYLAVGEDIKPALTELINSTSTFLFDNLVPMVGDIISALPDAVTTFIQEAVPRILDETKTFINDYLPNFLDSGVDIVTSLIDGLVEALPDLIQGATDLITNFIGKIAERLPDLIQSGIEIVVNLITGLGQAIPKIIEAIPKLTKAIIDGFMNTDWLDVGKQIINGIINGIKSMVGSLGKAIKGVAQDALDAIKDKLKIESPSKVFNEEVGKMIDAGIAEGITENANLVTDAMEALEAEIVPEMATITATARAATISSTISDITSAISGVSSAISTIKSAVSAYNQAIDGTENIINAMISVGNNISQKIEANRVSIRFNDRDIVQSYSRGSNLLGNSLVNQGV